MTRFLAIVLAAVISGGAGCVRLYFWAGEHEVVLPPVSEPAPAETPTPR